MVFKYVERKTSKAKKRPGKSYVAKGEKPKLGSGKRFKALEGALKKKGAKNPGALAGWIGRRKYGVKKMGQLSGAARKKGK